MRIFFLAVFFPAVIQAQLSTDLSLQPVAEYDMLTTSGGGTVLNDLSGNGHNGTIHGTTANAQGRLCNGTSDYIGMPILINNSDYTVIVISANSNPSTPGATWAESNATASQFVRFSTSSGSFTQINGSGGATLLPAVSRDVRPDYDVYFSIRAQNQLTGGMLSRVSQSWSSSNVNIGSVTVSGGGASICALNEGVTRVNFWQGTLAYFALYNFALSMPERQAVYQAMASAVINRSVFVHPWPWSIIPLITAPSWQRQGTVLSQTAAGFEVNESSVIYDANCSLISVPANCFKLWFSGGNGNGIEYAESPDGIVWTHHGPPGSTILTNPSHPIQPCVLKVGATYHLYVTSTGTTQVDHYTSSDGINWTAAGLAVISRGPAGAWDATLIANPHILYNPDASGNWYMLYGGKSDGTGIWSSQFRDGGATSVDGVTWTKASANPFTGQNDVFWGSVNSGVGGIGNPFLAYINGQWVDWSGSYGVVRFSSPVFNGLWIWSQIHPSIFIGSDDESNQLADPVLLEVNGITYLWYNGYSTNSPALGILKLVIAPMSLARLIQTNEGTTTDWP
jgi:hypothetical protein